MQTLHESPKYKTFIQDRNRALEQVNLNTQVDNSLKLHDALEAITGVVSYLGIQERMTLDQMKGVTHELSFRVEHIFAVLAPQLVSRIIRMRKSVFILTYLSELEAIARATQKTKIIDPGQFKRKLQEQMNQDTLTGKTLEKQTWLSLSKLQDRILQAFKNGMALEETPKEVVDRVKKTYPKLVTYKRPPRALKPIRESDPGNDEKKEKEFDFYHDLVTDDDWDLAVDSYLDTEIDYESRTNRGIYTDPDTGVRKYEWEVEQDTTDDFVQQVRQGQVAAANELGVKDFVWVAIIDKKTCEVCCLPRAGKTTSEIEEMLKSGELDKVECDAIVPPAHPFCRCDIAPVASTDPVEGADWKSFDKWLES